MKFFPVREIRTNYNKVMEQLRKEKKVILTSKGKPVALLTELNEENFEHQVSGPHRGSSAAETAAAYTAEDPEILKAWIEEAERRYDDYLNGKVKAIPAFKGLKDLRRKYRK